MRKFSILATLVLAFFAIACGGDEYADDQVLDHNDPAGLEDGITRPTGTWEGEGLQAGQFTSLALLSDKSFHAEVRVICVKAPCNPVAQDGTYRYTKSGATRYIKLYDSDGEVLSRYAYTLEDNTLFLRDATQDSKGRCVTHEWFTMNKSFDGYCHVPEDCASQGLFTMTCVGEYECNDNLCGFHCTTSNICEESGGQCVALVPGACEDGMVGDADTFPCGGGLGVMCCLPKPVAPVCDKQGTAEEGWYDATTGDKHCAANCAGSTANCMNKGTRSEGWYTDEGAGCGGGTLVGWDNCDG